MTFKIVYKIVKSFEKINGKKENINAIRNYVGEFLKKFICLSHDTIVFQVAMYGKNTFFTDFFKKDETIDNLLNGIKVFGVSSSGSETTLSLNLNNNKDMEEICKLKKIKIRDEEYYLLIPSFDSIIDNRANCKMQK